MYVGTDGAQRLGKERDSPGLQVVAGGEHSILDNNAKCRESQGLWAFQYPCLRSLGGAI